VNKPDWFEPGEMTYLGFNNDYSEVPTVMSDKIDFSINYADTTKKFLDDSSYDGTIQGANELLKCTVSSGTYTLTFPIKNLLLVKVKPTSSSGTFKFTAGSSDTTLYTVYDEKIFALKPSQITATTVKFTVSGLTVVSAEISNRPYSSKTAAATYNSTDTAQINIGNTWFNGCEETGSETTVSVTGLNNLLTANATKNNGILTYTGGSLTSKSQTLTVTATTGSAAVNETISSLGTGTKSGTMFSYKRNSSSIISETIDFWKNTCSNSSNFSFTYTPKASGADTIRLSSKYYGDITFSASYGYRPKDWNSSGGWRDICYCKDTGILWAIGDNDSNKMIKSYNGVCWIDSGCAMRVKAIAYDPYRKKFVGIGVGYNSIWRTTDQYGSGQESSAVGNLPWEVCHGFNQGSIAISDTGNYVVMQGESGWCAYSTNGGSSWTNYNQSHNADNVAYSSAKNLFLWVCKGADIWTMANPPTSSVAYYDTLDIARADSLDGPVTFNNGAGSCRFVTVDDQGRFSEVTYDTKALKKIYDANIGQFWGGVTYTSLGGYYVAIRNNGEVRTYATGGSLSGEISISSHYIKYGSTTTNVGTNGTSMTIPATGLACNDASSYYIDVTTTGACANSASISCYTESDTLTMPSGITSGKVRFSTAMKNTRGKIACTTTNNSEELTAAGSLDVTNIAGKTSLVYKLDGLTASSAQMINCYMPCETGGSIAINGITSVAKQREGTVYLKAKVRSGQTGKIKMPSTGSEQNVTNTSGADYSVAIANTSGDSVAYTFPNNNALINTQKVSARYDYSIPAGGTVSWNGIGKRIKSVTLTVAPTTSSAGSIAFSNLSNNSTYNQNIAEQKDITVDGSYLTADNLKYTLTNAVILSASVKYKLLQPYQFTKPTVPNLSSYVNFSQKTSDGKPVHGASSLAVFGRDTAGALGTISYDSDRGYWCATGGSNNFYDMQPYAKGEGYLLVEDLSTSTATFDIWYGVNGTKASRWKYYLPGLTRLYFDEAQMNPSNGFSSGGKHAFLVGGVTQPINAALYNYAKGKTAAEGEDLTAYVTPSTDFNRATLKALTTAACSKLKAAGARVYVVKYRKQSGWKALTRNGTAAHSSGSGTHSYTEIDACATSTGGTAYDVADEAALKTTLDAIAAEIKTWAGYEEAKNVAE
jgi:hypothetical protein